MNREELTKTALDLSKGDRVRLQLDAITDRHQVGVPIVEDDISDPYESEVVSKTRGMEEDDSYYSDGYGRVYTTSNVHSVSFRPHPNHDTDTSYYLDVTKHRDGHVEPTSTLKQYLDHPSKKRSIAHITGFEVVDSD